MTVSFKEFPDLDALHSELKYLLSQQFSSGNEPFAVMLAGGSTPMAVYSRIAEEPPTISPQLHLLFSDDRHVPPTSKDSNFGNTLPMIQALGLPEGQVLRVDADLQLDQAAEAYAASIQDFLDQSGAIEFGIIGMGADGHTCSLFTKDDARREDAVAFPAPTQAGFNRVTVSRVVLRKTRRLIFLVTGESKRDILMQFRSNPLDLPAGIAVDGHPNVELWTDLQL